MPSAVDIITYIGVPLAVLGVMPVLYTCFTALITKTRVQRTVKQAHLPLTTRVGLLAGLVEVDLPRYQIHTLPRAAPEYWLENPKRSVMRGGSWTALNWQRVAVGKCTYRIQHWDELRQPQAEVDMGDLVTFLLDRGAQPSAHGLQLLRLMGLQTPPGTPILMADGEGSRPVLVVASPDESEGRLSLKLVWDEEVAGGGAGIGARRGLESLPPYWVRLVSGMRLSAPPRSKENDGEENVDEADKEQEKGEEKKPIPTDAGLDLDSDRPHPPVRLYLGIEGLQDARHDTLFPSDANSFKPPEALSIAHLLPDPRTPDAPVPLWFACAVVSVCSMDATGLFRFNIPARIQAFSRRETIPHRVLVLLGMRSADESPLFRERRALQEAAERDRRVQELKDQSALMLRMQKMSQQDRMQTQMEESMKRLQRMQNERTQRALEELEAKADALASPRVGCNVVADAALTWLKKTNERIPQDADLKSVATAVVHAMIFDADLAHGVCGVLASWVGWMDLLMTEHHFEYFKNNQLYFCLAAVILHQIAEYEFNVRVHPVAKDLDDCQRVWGKVYLG